MSYGGPHSQEGLYPRSSPPSDGHDIIAHAPDAYYHDDEYESQPQQRRRDTMMSDGSDGVEGERYYDHNGPYDPYGMHTFIFHLV
jgi:1,3-beta-glucan synthase